jgi:hypothetical protein
MKRIADWTLVVLLSLLSSCGGEPEQTPQAELGGYLDSTYVSKGYRAAMDSIHSGSGISDGDFKLLQSYMREFRDSIQNHPTYRELLDRAKGLDAMRDGGVGMKVKSMSLHHVQKLSEIRLVLAFANETNKPLAGFRGAITWLDSAGKAVSVTPSFSVVGPILPGDSVTDLRLEYVLYKPTGNELNDPRRQASRDTLEAVEAIAKRKNLQAFKFKLHDIRLGNGLTPGQYWMKSKEERDKLDAESNKPMPKPMQLFDWADAHKDWIAKLAAHNSEFGLLISPVITERGEMGNGKNLVLDRIQKVQAFFNIQKHVYNSNMNQSIAGKKLVLAEYVDYWNWPMEIRIYQQ